MRPDVVAFVGQQTSQAFLATALAIAHLVLFRRDRRQFLFMWGAGWVAIAATRLLTAVEAASASVPGILDPPVVAGFLSDWLGFLSLATLAAGVRAFDRGRDNAPRLLLALVLGAAALAVVSTLGGPDQQFPWRYPMRTGLAAIACLAGGPIIWRGRSGRPGARGLAIAIAAYAVPMGGYAVFTALGDGTQLGNTLDRVVIVGHVDTVMMAIMAFTMIVWLLSRERSATSAALASEQSLRAEIEAREARFRSVLERVPDALAVLDTDGTYLASVRPDRTFIGLAGSELAGHSVLDLVHVDDRARVRAALASLRGRPGATELVEVRVRHRDGHWVTLECSGTNCEEVPYLNGILLTARDVTDRRALERRVALAERLETIGRLAGGVAHDFNNLLTIVQGNATLLSERLDPDSREFDWAIEIEDAAVRGAHLTAHLVAFSRRRPIAPRVFDVHELISDLLPLLRRLLGESIAVEWQPADGACAVRADPHQFEHVVVNLCVNAQDAMPEGGRLGIKTSRESDGYMALEIRDEGVGMTEETMRRAFEPFFTTKEVGGSAGLGLATSYGIVEQVGGTIALESDVGRGTTAIVRLPLSTEPLSPVEPRRTKERLKGSGLLLVAEDEPAVRAVAARTLREAGFDVVEAGDGHDAAERLAALPAIRCLVTDVVMPRLSGDALARRIWETRPGLPVLFTSGYSGDFGPESLLPGRPAAFVQKPYQPEQLVAAVVRLLPGPTPDN